MLIAMLSRSLVVGVLLVASALLYEFYCPLKERRRDIEDVAASWDKEIKPPGKKRSTIAIGVNSNLDLIVSALDLLQALGAEPSEPVDHKALTSVSQLEQLVGYSMSHCAGVERTFTDQALFLKIVQTAANIEHTYHVGGNGALMARKIKQLEPNAKVMLVGPVGPTLKQLLHKDILTPSFSASSTDEVHMILEYPKGSQWGGVTALCANRVIFSHDISNSRLVALEEFGESLTDFKPNLIILSGAHLLDGEPREFQMSRLADIAKLLESIPRSIPVHWELATVGDLGYFYQLSNTLFTRIDSLGLNEQELRSAAISAQANFTDIPAKPPIGYVSDLLLWLMKEYSNQPSSRLTRIHFHSLTFQIVATLRNGPWSNTKESVMAGARIAGLQACDIHKVYPEKFELKINSYKLSVNTKELSQSLQYSPQKSAAVKWGRDNVDFDLCPVLVCKKPLKTVGLGDAISSVGLLYSDFAENI